MVSKNEYGRGLDFRRVLSIIVLFSVFFFFCHISRMEPSRLFNQTHVNPFITKRSNQTPTNVIHFESLMAIATTTKPENALNLPQQQKKNVYENILSLHAVAKYDQPTEPNQTLSCLLFYLFYVIVIIGCRMFLWLIFSV